MSMRSRELWRGEWRIGRGQAVLERTLLQRQSDNIMAQATLEWNQALLAHYSLQSMPGGPFGFIMDRGAAIG